MIRGLDTCALCPRLCRPACPVASGSSREAAVPAVMAAVLLDWTRGRATPEMAAEAATLCTDCGGCQDHCLIDRPLPALLRQARAALLPAPEVEPLRPIEGEEGPVAVEADARPLAAALARRLGGPVRRWVTADRLGVALREHPGWQAHARALREAVGEAEVVVADGGVAQALAAAAVPFRWLHEVLPELGGGLGSCAAEGGARPLRCCGAAGPLAAHHLDDALRVGQAWLREASGQPVLDARCRDHLVRCGGAVRDPLDALLEEER